MKRAVLLMAYGAPDRPEDIAPFYTDIRGGRPPTEALLHELAGRYNAIGGASPLSRITRAQAQALREELGPQIPVYVGMRHWNPRIAEAVAQMASDGIEEATAIVLAPHYSRMSVGKYFEALDAAVAATPGAPTFRKIDTWHLHPIYLDALASRTRDALSLFPANERSDVMVVFTAHSLPQRILEWSDPYPVQLSATAQHLAEMLNIRHWRLGYQSAGRTNEPWLGPDLLQVIDEEVQAGRKSILVCVIGFIADHLEVLYDVDIEARAHAAEHGVHLERITMLNSDPILARCLADLARSGQ